MEFETTHPYRNHPYPVMMLLSTSLYSYHDGKILDIAGLTFAVTGARLLPLKARLTTLARNSS